MEKWDKEIDQATLNNEKEVLKKLKKNYEDALGEIDSKIAQLLGRDDADMQHVIYQVEYQKALKTQVTGILDMLQANEFETISEYLTKSYDEGFLGAMYSMQSQGVPLVLPIDQEQVVNAIQHETKLSESLYESLGKDIKELNKKIAGEISRGISTGMMYSEIARNIASYGGISRNKAMRIARTEAHRIQSKANFDAQKKAQSKGADIVKIWSSALDSKTRPTHRKLDGQIRELDKPFELGSHKAMHPGDFGVAKEDINCRCRAISKARWLLGDDVTKWAEDAPVKISDDGTTQLVHIKAKDYEDFKDKYFGKLSEKKYLNNSSKGDKIELEENVKHSETYNELKANLDKRGVEYKPVAKHNKQPTEEVIINMIAGGDKTKGSCASLGLAYIGQKNGLNILDFRGGESQSFFSMKYNLDKIMKFIPEENVKKAIARSYITSGNKLLQEVEIGKEYYFYCGRHASIVRKTEEGVLQYLELQSASNNGWKDFNGNPRYTLSTRFGCAKTAGRDVSGVMVDIDAFKDSKDLEALLGYINTAEGKQMKGVGGYAR